jgi:N-acetylglutamate synthase-like GNAT family acetyltransferase
MGKAVIRRAGVEDTEKILAMLLEMDSYDYLQHVWPVWIRDSETVELVAMVEGRTAGCIHGRLSNGQDAWLQGLRVRTDFRRRKIATSLITTLEGELCGKGARTVFATISPFNQPSLSTFARLNWKVVFSVVRRRWSAESVLSVVRNRLSEDRSLLNLHEISRLVRQSGILASRRATSFFKRVYFSMTDEFLQEALAASAVRANTLHAVAILAPELLENKGLWVTALSGTMPALTSLIINLAAEGARDGLDLVVDGSDEAEPRALLDSLGFATAGKDGQFVVVKKELLFP